MAACYWQLFKYFDIQGNFFSKLHKSNKKQTNEQAKSSLQESALLP